jgi:hypothetical protein
MGGSHGGQRSTRCPKNDGVLKEQFVTAVTPAEAEAWHAARAVDTEASMRLSCSCRSGQAPASTDDTGDTGLPAPTTECGAAPRCLEAYRKQSTRNANNGLAGDIAILMINTAPCLMSFTA